MNGTSVSAVRSDQRGRDADEAGHALRHTLGEDQGDPAAHGRADQDLRALGQPRHRLRRVVGPVADRVVLESA